MVKGGRTRAAYVRVQVQHALARVVHHVVVDTFRIVAEGSSIPFEFVDRVRAELLDIFQLHAHG